LHVPRDDDLMRSRLLALLVAGGLGAAASVAGCTGDDDATTGGPTSTAAASAPAPSAVTTPPGSPPAVDPTEPTVTVEESLPAVPETGVPGLDSQEVVCRAWSRFAGSFQMVSVAAAFGSGDPVEVAALEVIAAPTVTAAYDELVANWPDELAPETEAAASSFFGPFARRAQQALAALQDAGADPADLAAIAAAWEDALARRDPAEPDVEVALPEGLATLVDAAAEVVAAELPPIPQDPDLVVEVDVPLTEAYLAERCPDQGTLGGVAG
jgi:hypothetical protein